MSYAVFRILKGCSKTCFDLSAISKTYTLYCFFTKGFRNISQNESLHNKREVFSVILGIILYKCIFFGLNTSMGNHHAYNHSSRIIFLLLCTVHTWSLYVLYIREITLEEYILSETRTRSSYDSNDATRKTIWRTHIFTATHKFKYNCCVLCAIIWRNSRCTINNEHS